MSNPQINLPKTAFSMKANLPVREPEILEYWKKINLISRAQTIQQR
jgi:isoleucyl-tRNA synthetase